MSDSIDSRRLALRSLFESHRDAPWVFVRPGGNYGDDLIYAGADKLATRCGLAWQTCNAETFPRFTVSNQHCIYLHGGGGLNTWGRGRAFHCLAEALSRDVRLVIQGPQTIESAADAIKQRLRSAHARVLCEQLVFFARDPFSFSILQQMNLERAEIGLEHDTALNLEAEDLLELAALDAMPGGRYDLIVLRQDDEQPSVASANSVSQGIVCDPAYVADSFEHWLRIHLFSRAIVTNRLHSAIAGAIADKPVTLSGGSYHKNRSIWEFSLEQRGVRWADEIHASRSIWDTLPNRFRDSYKLRKLRFLVQRIPLR
jgi:exopolysaccharide biosynthesis predicted pyruvyltransferase EpsI